jgi:hypothetical protein
MTDRVRFAIVIVAVIFGLVGRVGAQALSIYQIQFTTDVNGTSPENGNIVDCLGGIVIHKTSPPVRSRLTLYDPDYPDGWGGIVAKDLYSIDAFNDVNVGDWVSFTNVEVEDFKGTTLLQYISENDANFTIVSRDNPLPRPLLITVDKIAAPVEGIDQWIVADHNAERYEAMLVKVVDVNVKDTGYGKAYDNYILESNLDANSTCWASDYMNEGKDGIYHPYVQVGQNFCGVGGIVEQYMGERYDIYYDYYQLLTISTESFTIDQTADLNYDCAVDFIDYGLFAVHWLEDGCTDPNWCGGADLTRDEPSGIVDSNDLLVFTDNWLEGKY